MMSIRDDQPLVPHLAAHQFNQAGIGDPPNPVQDAVFVGDLGGGRRVLGQQCVDLAGVVIKHENLTEVRPGGTQQVEAIRFRFGQGLLVAKHNLGRIVFDPSQGNEAPPLGFLTGSRDQKPLGVGVDGGLRILQEDTIPPPIPEEAGGACVDILGPIVSRFPPSQDQAHQVVRTRGVIALLRLRSNLVIRLRHHRGRRDPSGIVTKRAKRKDVSHGKLAF